jgi:hypothetical protein
MGRLVTMAWGGDWVTRTWARTELLDKLGEGLVAKALQTWSIGLMFIPAAPPHQPFKAIN